MLDRNDENNEMMAEGTEEGKERKWGLETRTSHR